MRTQIHGNEAEHHKQTETKTKGRRTVASTTVLSMLRMGWVRSDLPPLFNQKSFIMRTQNDGANSPNEKAISAETILNTLFDSDFTDDLRTDLREMIDAYLLSEDEADYRDQRYSSFMWIDALLKDIQLYQNQPKLKLVL